MALAFALIGAGFIGAVHARNLAEHPDVDLRWVHDIDPHRARGLAARHGARAAGEVADVLDDPSLDAVLIASSTDTHAELLVRTARAGKAILCEKPIDLDLTIAREAVAAVERAGVPAMVDFNRRFDPDYAHLRRLVEDGSIGPVELVQMTTRGPSLPPHEYIAVSGGQMRDQTVHFFDLLRWLTDLDPIDVFVAGAALADPAIADLGDVDASVVTLTLPGGALCQIDSVRRITYGYDERIEVLGANGLAEAGRQRRGFVSLRTGPDTVRDGLHQGWFERMEGTYREALDAFVTALTRGGPPTPSLADGLRAQAIAEAATESLRTGRRITIAY